MKASALMAAVNLKIEEHQDFEVQSLCMDHRKVSVGSIFVAIKGTHNDGHKWIDAAIDAGAELIIYENEMPSGRAIASLQVSDARKTLAQLAYYFYGRASDRLFCIGVTGTNGKTSTTLMIEQILNQAGTLTGVMGTIDHHCGEKQWISSLTTPDALTLHQRLSDFCDLGAKAVAMEVSSHALDQGRADSIAFDIAVFTNLTRDHLDYHQNMESYFHSKEILFKKLLSKNKNLGVAVVNADDPWAGKIQMADGISAVTYGQKESDFCFRILNQSFSGMDFELTHNNQKYISQLRMIGLHNIYNAVAATAVAYSLGVDIKLSLSSLMNFTKVPGRLQPIESSSGVFAFVDYAHTDDALSSSLQALVSIREVNPEYQNSKIHLVFGCGGDRDRGKRPLMAAAAEKLADIIYVTSDNPRTEDPERIITDILTGFSKDSKKPLFRIVDRREAIAKALNNAKKNDVVLVAGKGHEDYQIIGTEKLPFSDADEILKVLNGLPALGH